MKDRFEVVKEKEVFKGWELIKMCEEGKIKNGTVLQDLDGEYYTVFDGIVIEGERKEFNSDYEAVSSFFVRNNFRVVKKKYTFEEAFKAFEAGEEIESCITNDKFKKADNCNWKFKKPFMDEYSEDMSNRIEMFSVEEIRGKWYINN